MALLSRVRYYARRVQLTVDNQNTGDQVLPELHRCWVELLLLILSTATLV